MRHLMAATALLLAACGGQDGGDQAAGENVSADAPGGGSGAGSGTAGAVTMQPGLWEMTVEVAGMEMPNMPAGMGQSVPPTTVRTCLTPQQVARPGAEVFSGGTQNQGCSSENFSMAGGRIQGTVTCNAQGTTTRVTMDGQFSPTSYEVTQRSEVTAAGTNMTTQSRVTGRRLGDCPAGG